MKIVYICQFFCTPSESGGLRNYRNTKYLVDSGHQVQVITSDVSGDKNAVKTIRYNIDGIDVCKIPVFYGNHMPYTKRILQFGNFAAKAFMECMKYEADVIFSHSPPLTVSLPGIFTAKLRRVPFVFEVGDLWPEAPIAMGALKNKFTIWLAKWLEDFTYRNSVRISAQSPAMKTGVMARGYPEVMIELVPNSADFDLFQVGKEPGVAFRNTYEWLQGRRLLVYTGTIGKVNGVDYLAKLAHKVRTIDPEVRFLVVGDGREKDRVQQIAKNLGVLGHNFFMLGRVTQKEVATILSAADIVTSVVIDKEALWGNSANKFFDALGASKPIAINHGGWMADFIESYGAGLVLDKSDLDKAAHQLTSHINDEAWIENAGAASMRLGLEQFEKNMLAAKLEQLLRDAAAERAAG